MTTARACPDLKATTSSKELSLSAANIFSLDPNIEPSPTNEPPRWPFGTLGARAVASQALISPARS